MHAYSAVMFGFNYTIHDTPHENMYNMLKLS
jgi:hypothetical protein